jgi:hypothetical protein
MATRLPQISYPALLWREGYIYLAKTPLNLCAHPRSLFAETVQKAKAGDWRLADSDGRSFEVVDWVRVPPFGGISAIAPLLTFSIFAVPILANENQPALAEFKKILARAVIGRYRYDTDKGDALDSLHELRRADSYRAAIDALPKL